MVITAIEHTSSGYTKLTAAGGGVCVVREEYLNIVLPSKLYIGCVLEGAAEEDIIRANICVAAERQARALLSRAEQCRLRLEQKLIKRGNGREGIKDALDYLEQTGELSNARFARAYLVSRRMIGGGRMKMEALLASKGIDRRTACKALDEFFNEYSEEDMCRRALRKGVRLGKRGEKLAAYLVRGGFSRSMVQTLMKEREESEGERSEWSKSETVSIANV